MTNKEIIAVVQAAEAGKKIQTRSKQRMTKIWFDNIDIVWNFSVNEYRVKPEPREFYAIEFPPLGPVGGKLHLSRESAEFHADDTELYRKPRSSAKIIKLREVLES